MLNINHPSLEDCLNPALIGAVGLLLILVLLLPRRQRGPLNLSLLFLVLYLVLLFVQAQLPEGSPALGLVQPAAAFFLTACLGRSAVFLVLQIVNRRLRAQPPRIFSDIAMGLVWGAALLASLHAAGVHPNSVLAGSALITAVIALALKDTLSHIFAGLAIQAQQPFEVGDWIQFDDRPASVGKVMEVNWRATTLVTADGVEVIIPNSRLADNLLHNFSRPQPWSRRTIGVVCPLEAPPGRVHEVILEVLRQQPDIMKEPPPSVLTSNFSEQGVEYQARYYIADFAECERIDSAVRHHLWYALNRHDITMAAPQQGVLLHEDSQAARQRQEKVRLAQRRDYLRQVDVFAGLPEDTLTRLARLAQTRLYAAGEVVVRQGDVGDELFVIHDGEVGVAIREDRGPEVPLRTMGPGQFFGEMSLLTGAPRSATVRALRDCELIVIAKPTFAALLDETPTLVEPIRQTLSRRQREQEEKRAALAADGQPPPENLVERFLQFFKLDRC